MTALITVARDAFCPLCSALVGHYWEGPRLLPVPHDAPCGANCAAGGVGGGEWLLGTVHREQECERCEALCEVAT